VDVRLAVTVRRKIHLLKNRHEKRVILNSRGEENMNILRMVNPVMPYAWGSKTFIQELTGDKSGLGQPQAELWMGAHPGSSSQIQNGDILVNMHYVIADDPCDFLGPRTANTFKDQLPFLLKVLAADQPLSVQVHPDKKQAREGFALENKLGIPLDAPHRNYRDDNHKPELLVALTEFHALCGFRDEQELTTLLHKYLPHFAMPELDNFRYNPAPDTLKILYSAILNSDAVVKQTLLDFYLKHVHSLLPATPQEQLINEWTVKLNELHPNDIGVISPLLMNVVTLKPMEGLFLEPGVPHSYLCGAGIEIMANSDNVLRGGLTSKHSDKDELLKALVFATGKSKPVQAEKVSDTEKTYPTLAEEFALSVITHSKEIQTDISASGSPEIIFCYEGSFVVENCSQYLTIEKGQSLFVPYEVEGYAVQGKGTLFRARVNL
jgi:mannose-6-phosphate isomerase